jgi:hypothetical protein
VSKPCLKESGIALEMLSRALNVYRNNTKLTEPARCVHEPGRGGARGGTPAFDASVITRRDRRATGVSPAPGGVASLSRLVMSLTWPSKCC